MEYTVEQVAGMIDHTNLHAYASEADLKKLCDEAIQYGFKSVAINTYPVKECRKWLEGSNVLTGAALSFPLGQTTIETKADELKNAIKDGCQEFDYVLNIGKLLDKDYDYIRDEMTQLVTIGREHHITSKVIFETCYLQEEDIIAAARIASEVKPDFVKTSTGFGTAGAKVEHVKLMKKYAGKHVQVKAAGGIRTWEAAKAMLDAGATRLGTSSGIKIIEEMKAAGLH
jgi:deoxyribose-phosphate aldolase